MDIYKARKLQTLLFKRSNAGFKRMRTLIDNDKLYYIVLHHIGRGNSVLIDENVIRTVGNNIGIEVETSIEFINKEINSRVPEGMYAAEFIEID